MPERMYQSGARESEAMRAAIIEAVLSTVRQDGLGDLTVRKIATRLGVSPALVNYHFGSQALLIEEACIVADQRIEAAWSGWTQLISDTSTREGDFEACLFAAIRDLHCRLDREHALQWHALLRSIRAKAQMTAHAGQGAARIFWENLLETAGVDTQLAASLRAFSLGVGFGYVVAGEQWKFDPWAHRLCGRFAARLQGRPLHPDGDSAFRQSAASWNMAPAAPQSMHPTHVKIINAAVDIILKDGAEAITHRSVAASAGVSLSSVTHFIKGKEELLKQAHDALFQRTRSRTDTIRADKKRPSIEAMANSMFSPDTIDWSFLKDLAGTSGAMLTASVQESSRSHVEGTFARFGDTSMDLLSRVANEGSGFGRLDAQIFSLCASNIWFVQLLEGMEPSHALLIQNRSDMKRLIEILCIPKP
nr:TetR family transcriptional regulator [uncultured Hyphomonas sp.]